MNNHRNPVKEIILLFYSINIGRCASTSIYRYSNPMTFGIAPNRHKIGVGYIRHYRPWGSVIVSVVRYKTIFCHRVNVIHKPLAVNLWSDFHNCFLNQFYYCKVYGAIPTAVSLYIQRSRVISITQSNNVVGLRASVNNRVSPQ